MILTNASAVIKGLCEMHYNRDMQKQHDCTFAEAYAELRAANAAQQVAFWNKMTHRLHVDHDVHFDMEEYNSKPDTRNPLFETALTKMSSSCRS